MVCHTSCLPQAPLLLAIITILLAYFITRLLLPLRLLHYAIIYWYYADTLIHDTIRAAVLILRYCRHYYYAMPCRHYAILRYTHLMPYIDITPYTLLPLPHYYAIRVAIIIIISRSLCHYWYYAIIAIQPLRRAAAAIISPYYCYWSCYHCCCRCWDYSRHYWCRRHIHIITLLRRRHYAIDYAHSYYWLLLLLTLWRCHYIHTYWYATPFSANDIYALLLILRLPLPSATYIYDITPLLPLPYDYGITPLATILIAAIGHWLIRLLPYYFAIYASQRAAITLADYAIMIRHYTPLLLFAIISLDYAASHYWLRHGERMPTH